ncbi:hypothetical protein FXW78_20900 [Rhodococcus opacus]|nr:hypothetical protein [Rhodococcus opacus]
MDKTSPLRRSPTRVRGRVDDRLALYPQTSRVLHLLSKPRAWEAIDTLFRSPEHLRAHLRHELDWVTVRSGCWSKPSPSR